ncbi:Cyclic nucleotide-gated potassium channel [Botrimarina colliarenosi]|uniref:Cyclic nucleotide-gated potassium channel n=1 Tax=Botrimarina colliarenosi TaxID=2528001 RepID=A0A5C6AKN8_9BACT|nr:transporter substrate-binding domain-containing protein [Botrimarina colliarenosi]TWT99970.1 Cyclic nucleotide-gated potassium channel [Botrimarina colliarenosi]
MLHSISQQRRELCWYWRRSLASAALALLAVAPTTSIAQPTTLTDGVLLVATREVPPFAMRDEQGVWRGISIELTEAFRRELEKTTGDVYTIEYRDMGIEPMLAAVENGEVDMAAAAITVNFEREKRLDFSHAFHSSGLGIAAGAGDRVTGLFGLVRSILSPTFLGVVAALLSTMLATGVAIYYFERHVNREQFGGGFFRGVASGLWWSAVTLTTVGYGDKVPKSPAGRFIGLLWMFSGLFIIASFTAAITSALTLTQLRSRINGPADLPRARVATVEGSTSAAYLRARRIYARGEPDIDAALEDLIEGRVDAVVYDAPVLRYEVHNRFEEEVVVLPAEFERQDYAFALPPNSPLRETVNQALLRTTSDADWSDSLARLLGEPTLE